MIIKSPETLHGFAQQANGQSSNILAEIGARPRTVYGWLQEHAETRPNAPAVAEWRDKSLRSYLTFQSARDLVDQAARGLYERGVRRGDRVVVALENGVEAYCAIIAIISTGAVVVPTPPGAARSNFLAERVRGIISDCTPTLVLTDSASAKWVHKEFGDQCSAATHQQILEDGAESTRSVPLGNVFPLAVIQYTSGSTGRPRGIVVSHDMLYTNCAQAALAYLEQVNDVGVTWAPLYHDLGLNTGVMRPLFTGYQSILLRPSDFVRNPLTWLQAIQTCGGTLSSGPNFAYDLCVRKVGLEQATDLNLSSWRIARNAGEVVHDATMERFSGRFAQSGFRPGAICTGYGLAEATLSVATCSPKVRPLRLPVLGTALKDGFAAPIDDLAASNETAIHWLLSSGIPLADTSVRAGDGNGRVGRISICGPQVADCIWDGSNRVPERTNAADGWYNTGDLGFIYQGHLFVLGRADDTIVYRGRNFYLSDVVAACQEIPHLRPGRAVAFVIRDEQDVTDKTYIVAEVRPDVETDAAVLAELSIRVRRHLASILELYATHVIFVRTGTLPITTSGKLRASEVKRRFDNDSLSVIYSNA